MSATDNVASRKRPGDTRNEPAAKQKNSKPSAIDYAAVIKGMNRKLRTYNPMTINRNLYNVLGGNYKDIKVLPSGDLFVNCQNKDQLARLLQCKNLGDNGGNKEGDGGGICPTFLRVAKFHYQLCLLYSE